MIMIVIFFSMPLLPVSVTTVSVFAKSIFFSCFPNYKTATHIGLKLLKPYMVHSVVCMLFCMGVRLLNEDHCTLECTRCNP